MDLNPLPNQLQGELLFPQPLLDSIPFGVMLTDPDLHVVQLNKWIVAHTQVDPQAARGAPLGQVFPELTSRNLLEAYKLVLHGGMPLTLSNRIHRYFFKIASRDRSQGEMPQTATISPVRAGSRVIGTLTVITDVSERVNVESSLQREVDKLSMLHEIDHAVSTLNFSACLKIIVERTRVLFGASGVTLYLFEDGNLQPAAFDAPDKQQPANTGLASWVAIGSRSDLSPDASADERFNAADCGVRCEMAAPLLVEGNCIGVLNVQIDKVDVYSNDDLDLLEAIAVRAAISIHNAQLHTSERTQRELAESLRHIGQTLAAELDLEAVLDAILNHLDRVIPYDAAGVALYEHGQLHFKRLLGFEAECGGELLAAAMQDSDFIHRLEHTGEPLVHHGSLAPALQAAYVNWAGAPIIIRGRLTGFLLLAKKQDLAYDANNLAHLGAFAVSAGVALENARLYAQQQILAVTDGLTGLTNRRRFDDDINRELDRVARYTRPTSLIMLDIDNFKRYNDTFGHPAGDGLLKCLAAQLRKVTREVDILARYGGEEFAIILPEVGVEAAWRVAERIRAAVSGLYNAGAPQDAPAGPDLPQVLAPVTVSLGVSSAPQFARTPAELIYSADTALYRAKRGGKNQTMIAEVTPQPS